MLYMDCLLLFYLTCKSTITAVIPQLHWGPIPWPHNFLITILSPCILVFLLDHIRLYGSTLPSLIKKNLFANILNFSTSATFCGNSLTKKKCLMSHSPFNMKTEEPSVAGKNYHMSKLTDFYLKGPSWTLSVHFTLAVVFQWGNRNSQRRTFLFSSNQIYKMALICIYLKLFCSVFSNINPSIQVSKNFYSTE